MPNMFKVNNKDIHDHVDNYLLTLNNKYTITTFIDVVLVSLSLTLNMYLATGNSLLLTFYRFCK